MKIACLPFVVALRRTMLAAGLVGIATGPGGAAEPFANAASHHWEELANVARMYGKVSKYIRECRLNNQAIHTAYLRMLIRSKIPRHQFYALAEIQFVAEYGNNLHATDCRAVAIVADELASGFQQIDFSESPSDKASHHWDDLTDIARRFGHLSRFARLCAMDDKQMATAYYRMIAASRIPREQFDALTDIAMANDLGSNATPDDCKAIARAATEFSSKLRDLRFEPPSNVR